MTRRAKDMEVRTDMSQEHFVRFSPNNAVSVHAHPTPSLGTARGISVLVSWDFVRPTPSRPVTSATLRSSCSAKWLWYDAVT